MPNRLIHEKSPYLLQHAHNPVDWYPWGAEAFAVARRANKPIFLSVGYATCHWCHVMEKESFEDAEAATVLNNSFVCVKVDREERPDIDAVYMAACQMINGSGGWPLTIILTPDKKPFFAGTYIPKQNRFGRMGLIDLCDRIAALWKSEPDRVKEAAEGLVGHLQSAFDFDDAGNGQAQTAVLDQAYSQMIQNYDTRFGGFEGAPKFPTAHRLIFLLRTRARTGDEQAVAMVTKTLTAMRLGGLWDHVGFGFHRYATDRQWLVPHFEKMLYDQALLAMTYLEAFEVTGNALFAQTACEIFAYVRRDMTAPQGGFYTAEDADSEGEEGKFYLWSQAEFERIVGGAGDKIPWGRIFNLQPEGNFLEEASRQKIGTNILHLTHPWEHWAATVGLSVADLAGQWEQVRQRLFDVRAQRVAPLKDDKILTDWNGLMIAALALGGRVLKDHAYVSAAHTAAQFVFTQLMDSQGNLQHRYRDGQTAIAANANDYAFFIMGLIELYRTTRQAHWLTRATDLQQQMNARFWDQAHGGFYLTAAQHHELPVRPKELYDGALPSANAVAVNNLVHLGHLTGDEQWRQQTQRLIQAFAGSVQRQPMAYTHTLNGWDLALQADKAFKI